MSIEDAAVEWAEKEFKVGEYKMGGHIDPKVNVAFAEASRKQAIPYFIAGALWALRTPQKSPMSEHRVVAEHELLTK